MLIARTDRWNNLKFDLKIVDESIENLIGDKSDHDYNSKSPISTLDTDKKQTIQIAKIMVTTLKNPY